MKVQAGILVETSEHLVRCIVYMDMNMIRAGVVAHPSEWSESGYKEIQSPRHSYGLIDHQCLMDLLESIKLAIAHKGESRAPKISIASKRGVHP